MMNAHETYPIIKSPLVRTIAEYAAAALLVLTIILGITASEAATMTCLGTFLMVAAFAAKGIRGGFAYKSPWHPLRIAGRISMFAIGVLSLVLGIYRLLHR